MSGAELAGPGGSGREPDDEILVADPQAAVEAVLDGDRPAGPAPTVSSPGQGEIDAGPAERRVAGDPARVVEAEDGLGAEPLGPRPP